MMRQPFGLNIAALTLVGQNNGARKFSRCRETILAAALYGQAITTITAAAVYIFARPLISLFSDDGAVIAAGANYLRISVLVYWAYTALFLIVSALQGLKKPLAAVWIGIYRQALLPIPLFYLLARVFDWGLDGIWWGIFFINWSAAVIMLYYLRRVMRRLPAGQ